MPVAAPVPETHPPRVRGRGLHSQVVSDLGLRVVGGDLPVGTTLPRADELAAELGVSRSVVREGIRVLSKKGLLEARQRSGTRVRARGAWNLVDPDPTSSAATGLGVEVDEAQLARWHARDRDVGQDLPWQPDQLAAEDPAWQEQRRNRAAERRPST